MLLHSGPWEGGVDLLEMSHAHGGCGLESSSLIPNGAFPMDSIFWTLHTLVCALHGKEVQQVALLHAEAIPDGLLVRMFFYNRQLAVSF